MKETTRQVYPGETIAVIEEFLPGPGTYEAENGEVRATSTGVAKLDLENRRVTVSPRKKANIPRIGDEVMGVTTRLAGVYGIMTIESVNDAPSSGNPEAVVYPSRRLRRNEQQFQPGDFIYGMIDSTINRSYHISIRDDKYGVVRGLCQ
jgi:exosome complex RNA-binding protein Csl4